MEKKHQFKILEKEEVEKIPGNSIKNINIGIMGHIDSGKTSITKQLTTIASTASLDKNPQSQEKGITIDIGFSCFTVEPDFSIEDGKKYLQFTLVDCPGHASFMKSVIAGASIIDLMILVIDVNKGIQVQTAECIALGEIMQLNLIVILNKCDTLAPEKKVASIEKNSKAIYNLIQKTKYPNKSQVRILPFSCKDPNMVEQGKIELVEIILESLKKIERKKNNNGVMIVDHCFNIKGKGTVLTGTIIQGGFSTNDNIQLPEFNVERKIKGIHSFRKEIDRAQQGDRVAFLVSNLKTDNIERCFLCKPDYLKKIKGVVGTVDFCNYFKSQVSSKSKFHISIAHLNLMADIYFFLAKKEDVAYVETAKSNFKDTLESELIFDTSKEFSYVKMIDKDKVYLNNEELTNKQVSERGEILIGYFKFSRPVFLMKNNFYLASRFDFSTDKKVCRIAFSGTTFFNSEQEDFEKQLKLTTWKKRVGEVEKIFSDYVVVVRNLFKKETNFGLFFGKEIYFEGLELKGELMSTFGASGKVKVRLDENIKERTDLVGKKVFLNLKKVHKL